MFEPPFGGLRGNVTHSMYSLLESSWSISCSWQLNFFAISYGWDVISGNLSKSAFFRRESVTSRLNFTLNGYFSRQYLWTIRYGNGRTTTLPLVPLEVFTQRNFVTDFIRLKLTSIPNKSDYGFVWYRNICSVSFSFVTIHASARQTDGRTDRQNDESNTVRCITYRTVKTLDVSLVRTR